MIKFIKDDELTWAGFLALTAVVMGVYFRDYIFFFVIDNF